MAKTVYSCSERWRLFPTRNCQRNWRAHSTVCTTPFTEQRKLALTEIERGVGGLGAHPSKMNSTSESLVWEKGKSQVLNWQRLLNSSCKTIVSMFRVERRLKWCDPIQGPHPSKDPAFVASLSFRETLLTASAVVKWDGVAFGTFPGYGTRCFLLFLFFRAHRESWDMGGREGQHPPKREKRRPCFWGAFGGAFGSGQPSHGIVT